MSGSKTITSARAGSLGEDFAEKLEGEFFRTIVESVAEGVFAIDTSGRIVFANPGIRKVLGYFPEEFVGEDLSTFVPERFGKYHALTDLLTEEGVLKGSTFDIPAIHNDGHQLWLSISFAELEYEGITLLLGTVRDALERHEREEELARYERIIETIDDGIYVLDENFTITNVNEAIVSMTGYSREELIGSHASLLASDNLLRQAAELSAEMLENHRETATIISEIITKDGEGIPIETHFSLYPFEDNSYGQLGVIRDISDRKQFEETLRALHVSTRDLLTVDSKFDVSELIVDTATDLLDLAGAVIYLIDPDENVFRPTASSNGKSGFADSFPRLKPDNSLPWRVFVEGETAIIDDDDTEGTDVDLPIESGLCVPLGDHGVFIAATSDRRIIDTDTETLVGLLAASAEEALSRLDREIDIRERDRRLEFQNRRLRQLDKVNGIIREIGQILVKAESIDEIGEAVCDRLVASDRFAFAWFGEPNPSDGTIDPHSWSGDEPEYLDDVDFSLKEPREPAAIATTSKELTTVTDVGSDFRSGHWRKAALSQDYQSVLSVPLTHGDITHGVLTVYANQTEAFTDMETVFSELGETIANAMNAVMTRRTLLTDSRTELGFRLDAGDDIFQRFARQAGGQIEVEGVVPLADDATRVFFVTNNTDPELFHAVQEQSVVVETVNLIARRDDSCLFEAVVTGPTALTTIVDRGAMIRTVTASCDEIRFNVEIPNESSTRRFVEFVKSQYDDVELVSKTSGDRPRRTLTEFQYEFDDQVTDRQMEVLRIAYLRGFYEWPRESTGQEIADSLDVSQPTVNRHLRTCERKLFTMLFEGQ